MLSIISSVAFWTPVSVLIIRVLAKSGLFAPNNKFLYFICAEKGNYKADGGEVSVKDAAAIFSLAILFRILIYLASTAAIAFFDKSALNMELFLSRWRQWDVSAYIRIAEGGYTGYVEDGKFVTLAFFPLTAIFIRIVYVFTRNMELAAMIESTVLYGVGCVFMYKLMRIDYDEERAAGAVALISVFPYALFFGSGMSESTFFAMSAASLYYLRKGDYVMFSVFGTLTSLSRMVGVAIICPAVVEIFESYNIIGRIKRREKFAGILLKKLPFALAPVLGIVVYWFINYIVTGDAFKYLEYQKEVWHQGASYFGKSIGIMWDYAVNKSDNIPRFGIWIPGLLCVILMFASLIYGVRRHRSMYTTFFAACAFVNASLAWPISVPRYTSTIIPLFMVISDFCESHRRLKPLIYLVSATLMGIYLTGYLFSKQIL